MNTPTPPKPHPTSPQPNEPAQQHAPNGVPAGTDQADAKGLPNSGREDTETAAKP